MVQSPLRALIDPRRQLPIPTEGNHVRRRSDRYPCNTAARLRIGGVVHEVRFMDASYGGACVLAPGHVRPQPGAEGQLVARTPSGLCAGNVTVVRTQPQPDGTVIGFRLSEGPASEQGRTCAASLVASS